MLPIPTHLQNFLMVNSLKSDMNNVEGRLCCSCGCQGFKIKAFDIDENNHASVGRYNDDYAMKISTDCCNCGKNLLLFDMSKHGYDGFVCGDGTTVPNEKLIPFYCDKCQSNNFEVSLLIEAEDKEQFIEEVISTEPDRFTVDDYVDAFNWIVISLKCNKCNHEIKNWIDLELS